MSKADVVHRLGGAAGQNEVRLQQFENVRADVIVNALPYVNGIAEIAVYHKIKFKLFSRQVKSQCLCMVATHVGENITLYTKETQDFALVEKTLKQFVQEGKVPVFVGWQTESMERAF